MPSMAEVRYDLRPDLLGLASREEELDEGLEGGEGRVRSCWADVCFDRGPRPDSSM